MHSHTALIRQKVFNLAAFASVLILFFSFDLGENRKYSTTIDHVNNTYHSELTELDISAMDIVQGNIPAAFVREEFPDSSTATNVAIAILVLLAAGGLVMLFLRRPLAIFSVAAICVVTFFLLGIWLIDFSTVFPHRGSFAGPGETYFTQSLVTPLWDVIKFLLGLILLFNALHTPLLSWIGKLSAKLELLLAPRLVRKRTTVEEHPE